MFKGPTCDKCWAAVQYLRGLYLTHRAYGKWSLLRITCFFLVKIAFNRQWRTNFFVRQRVDVLQSKAQVYVITCQQINYPEVDIQWHWWKFASQTKYFFLAFNLLHSDETPTPSTCQHCSTFCGNVWSLSFSFVKSVFQMEQEGKTWNSHLWTPLWLWLLLCYECYHKSKIRSSETAF